jgi:hypothetical protein
MSQANRCQSPARNPLRICSWELVWELVWAQLSGLVLVLEMVSGLVFLSWLVLVSVPVSLWGKSLV